MNRRQREYAEKIKANRARDRRIAAYIYARVHDAPERAAHWYARQRKVAP